MTDPAPLLLRSRQVKARPCLALAAELDEFVSRNVEILARPPDMARLASSLVSQSR